MKKLILILALALPFTAQAKEDSISCIVIDRSARLVMGAHQSGVPYDKLIVALKDKMSEGYYRRLALMQAKEAYSEKRWETDSMKQKAIESFANRFVMACVSMKE